MIPAGDVPPVHPVIERDRMQGISLADAIVPVPGCLVSGRLRLPPFALPGMAVAGRNQKDHPNGKNDRRPIQTHTPRET
jgi:hypothetical protein